MVNRLLFLCGALAALTGSSIANFSKARTLADRLKNSSQSKDTETNFLEVAVQTKAIDGDAHTAFAAANDCPAVHNVNKPFAEASFVLAEDRPVLVLGRAARLHQGRADIHMYIDNELVSQGVTESSEESWVEGYTAIGYAATAGTHTASIASNVGNAWTCNKSPESSAVSVVSFDSASTFVHRVQDNRPGCPSGEGDAAASMISTALSYEQPGSYIAIGHVPRQGTGQHRLKLSVDNSLVDVATTASVNLQWKDGLVFGVGSLNAGTHSFSLTSDEPGAWGCGQNFGDLTVIQLLGKTTATFTVKDDQRKGCMDVPSVNGRILSTKFDAPQKANVLLMARGTRFGQANAQLKLSIDGNLVASSQTYTDSKDWDAAVVFYAGMVEAGPHEVFLTSDHPDAWGCPDHSADYVKIDIVVLGDESSFRAQEAADAAKAEAERLALEAEEERFNTLIKQQDANVEAAREALTKATDESNDAIALAKAGEAEAIRSAEQTRTESKADAESKHGDSASAVESAESEVKSAQNTLNEATRIQTTQEAVLKSRLKEAQDQAATDVKNAEELALKDTQEAEAAHSKQMDDATTAAHDAGVTYDNAVAEATAQIAVLQHQRDVEVADITKQIDDKNREYTGRQTDIGREYVDQKSQAESAYETSLKTIDTSLTAEAIEALTENFKKEKEAKLTVIEENQATKLKDLETEKASVLGELDSRLDQTKNRYEQAIAAEHAKMKEAEEIKTTAIAEAEADKQQAASDLESVKAAVEADVADAKSKAEADVKNIEDNNKEQDDILVQKVTEAEGDLTAAKERYEAALTEQKRSQADLQTANQDADSKADAAIAEAKAAAEAAIKAAEASKAAAEANLRSVEELAAQERSRIQAEREHAAQVRAQQQQAELAAQVAATQQEARDNPVASASDVEAEANFSPTISEPTESYDPSARHESPESVALANEAAQEIRSELGDKLAHAQTLATQAANELSHESPDQAHETLNVLHSELNMHIASVEQLIKDTLSAASANPTESKEVMKVLDEILEESGAETPAQAEKTAEVLEAVMADASKESVGQGAETMEVLQDILAEHKDDSPAEAQATQELIAEVTKELGSEGAALGGETKEVLKEMLEAHKGDSPVEAAHTEALVKELTETISAEPTSLGEKTGTLVHELDQLHIDDKHSQSQATAELTKEILEEVSAESPSQAAKTEELVMQAMNAHHDSPAAADEAIKEILHSAHESSHNANGETTSELVAEIMEQHHDGVQSNSPAADVVHQILANPGADSSQIVEAVTQTIEHQEAAHNSQQIEDQTKEVVQAEENAEKVAALAAEAQAKAEESGSAVDVEHAKELEAAAEAAQDHASEVVAEVAPALQHAAEHHKETHTESVHIAEMAQSAAQAIGASSDILAAEENAKHLSELAAQAAVEAAKEGTDAAQEKAKELAAKAEAAQDHAATVITESATQLTHVSTRRGGVQGTRTSLSRRVPFKGQYSVILAPEDF